MAKNPDRCITSSDIPIITDWCRRQISDARRLDWHDDMEIHLIKEGVGCYFVEGDNIAYGKNSIIVIQPREIHRLLSSPGSRLTKFCVMFNLKNMDWPRSFLKTLASMQRHISLTANEALIIEQITCKLSQELKERNQEWQQISQIMLREILCRIKRAEANLSPHSMHSVVCKALDYIEQHHADSFNVGEMADSLRISERHLFRLFESDIGLPIKHYVLQRRILEAQRMISANPAVKLEVVSEAVGFKQYSLFHRIFKKFTGIPPSAHGGI